ncbi:MAG: rubrerythrin family protein [Lentisphaerae bacterium]|nr:rubrerythrin family protein [Lentisphaerota bacterium]
MKKQLMVGVLGAMLLCVGLVCTVKAAEQTAGTTLENLQAAFNGESNAKVRYEAFAKKANEEGYKSVANLYRAISRSEEIHAAKHAEIIKKAGAEPKATIEKPDVKSTKENLEASIKGETYEKENMYPSFIKKAKADRNDGAVRTFKGAMVAEVEHAKLYSQALKEFDSWKKADKEFLVCQICGFTSMDKNLNECPICSAPRSKFDVFK